MKVTPFAIASALFFATTANASIELSPHAGQWDKIFWSQVKVDHTLPYGSSKDDDLFLYDVQNAQGVSDSLNWTQYDSNGSLYYTDMTFDWRLTRDNTTNETAFTFGDNALSLTTGDGEWEGLGVWFYTPGKHNQFDYAYIDWTLDSWNDNSLDNALWYRSDLGNNAYFEIWDPEAGNIDELSGTATFRWQMDLYGGWKTSPDDKFTVYLKGLDYYNVDFDDEVIIDEPGDTTPPVETPVEGGDGNVVNDVAMPPWGLSALLLLGGMMFFRRKRNDA